MLVVGYTIKLCSNSDGDEEDDLPMRVTQISESRPPINITLLPIMTARKSQKVSPLSLAFVSLLQALLARLIAHSAHWALALSLFFFSLSPLLAFQPVHQYIHAHKSLRCSEAQCMRPTTSCLPPPCLLTLPPPPPHSLTLPLPERRRRRRRRRRARGDETRRQWRRLRHCAASRCCCCCWPSRYVTCIGLVVTGDRDRSRSSSAS